MTSNPSFTSRLVLTAGLLAGALMQMQAAPA
jgi:hypothetical protein